MSHFAEINPNNNTVSKVIVWGDEGTPADKYGGTWIQTSYNANIRKNYAGVGFTYDAERDAFIAPKPFESWLLDEETCQWKAPIEYPTDGIMYQWNETDKDWEAIVNESN
jgi:hypothetical protein